MQQIITIIDDKLIKAIKNEVRRGDYDSRSQLIRIAIEHWLEQQKVNRKNKCRQSMKI